MSSRITLPLRLVQCDWGATGSPTTATASAAYTTVLTPYKPCGLPCYAASQVSAVSVEAGGSRLNNGFDNTIPVEGRRLFAIHTRQTSMTSPSSSSVEASAQPRPEDPSDSLLTRVIDTSLPGCRPYVALPVLSSLLRRSGNSTRTTATTITPPHAGLLNQWTSRHKGLVLVTQSPSDAIFLRNAAQLDLVQQTYRVVCRLPRAVAAAVRRYLQASQTAPTNRSQTNLDRKKQGGNSGSGAGAATALNLHLRAHAERQYEAAKVANLTYGIPLHAATNGVLDFAGAGLLPAEVRPNPLVSGGFFDVARGLLRVQGTVKCFLRVQTPLHPASQRKVDQFARLKSLFIAPPSSGSSKERTGASAKVSNENAAANSHPWLKPEWRIGISLDAPNMQSGSVDLTDTGNEYGASLPHQHARFPAQRGKSLSFDFRLISISAHDDSDLALYEVHTRGDVTADEIATVFQAEGLPVLNDYVQDTALARVIAEMAQRMLAAPPSLMTSLPMGVQHYLRTASAEELVALPLTLVPLEDADRLCIQQALYRKDALNKTSTVPGLPSSVEYAEEELQRMRHYVQLASGGGDGNAGSRHPLQRLLWYAIGSLHLANAEEKRAYEQLLTLTLGSGIECASLIFPDPSNPSTVHAMQHVWLTYEQQRQRHPSLADAARAARQHPSAAELRYVRRSVLDDSMGLTRLPLVEDMMLAGRGRNRSTARGESSFSQAVALAVSLKATETSLKPSTPTACMTVVPPVKQHSATLWDQIEVPPSYTEAYKRWTATSLAPLNNENNKKTVDETNTTVMTSNASLWPSPVEIKKRQQQQRRAVSRRERDDETEELTPSLSDQSADASSTLSSTSLPVRVFLRVEELAELSCAHCGAQGHSWQHCAARTADAVAALEDTSAVLTTTCVDRPTLLTTQEAVPFFQAAPMSGPLVTSLMEDEGLTSVEDAAAVLADQASAAAHRREQRPCALADYEDSSTHSASPSVIVPVPNVAATQQFKAGYMLRHEARKPAIHRRTVRCVYCGGYHHVTACPRLQAQEHEAQVEREVHNYESAAAAETEKTATVEQLPLFCIKCGEKGHIYRDCPRVPGDLYPATHCPICRQPRTMASHDPLHCPQRVPVPTGYALTGIPQVQKEGVSSFQTNQRSDGSRHNGGHGENCKKGSRTASAGSGFVRPRRRRGSVLIADSFVDSPSRGK